ncbi:DDE-type integrase/transposase/recombinase [Erysipelothrix sp. HDW6B]|uniref:DDE-type integrase/transposase/recombinase n=1 Tax=Erysipelothrix sp. HDW6B TaxID=2714929 RepID=UPI00351A1D50
MSLPRTSTDKPSFKASQHTNNGESINCLSQEFSPSEPNKLFVSDFTYIKTSKGFRYHCVIMDFYSRKIIVLKLSNRMNSTLNLMSSMIRTKQESLKENCSSIRIPFYSITLSMKEK